MSRINNLYNLHKIREAKITEDNKQLIVNFEMSKPVGLKRKNYYSKFSSSKLSTSGELTYNQKTLSIVLSLDRKDPKKLYKLMLVVSYLLADEITFYYRYSDLPYYDLPHFLNCGGYDFSFVNQKFFIENPKITLEIGFDLLNNKNSYFSKVIPFLLEVNTIIHHDVRFFVEYSLLEKLAQDFSKKAGKIFSKKSEKEKAKKLLSELSNNFNSLIKEDRFKEISDPIFRDKIINILNLGNINQKGNTKDKITDFLESFKEKQVNEYAKYVVKWNDMRNKRGIAHGSGLGKENKKDDTDFQLTKHIHQLLTKIVYIEFHNSFRK